jgi:hypothetical protein
MTRVRRLPHVDALEVEDGTVVVHGEQASLLPAISAAVWNSLDETEWAGVDVVAEHLTHAFGPPPSDTAVPELLTELAAAGLVELEP